MPAPDSTTPTSADLDTLLQGFLQGNPAAREMLIRRTHTSLLREVDKAAPDLAQRDLAEEVVQQLWAMLLVKKPGAFDSTRAGARTYLGVVLNDAARRVRADNTPPGARTRLRRGKDGHLAPQRPAASLDQPIPGGDNTVTLGESLPDLSTDEEMIVTRLDAANALGQLFVIARRNAPPAVRRVLHLVTNDDMTRSEAIRIVAAETAVHRTTILRQTTTWLNHARAELAK